MYEYISILFKQNNICNVLPIKMIKNKKSTINKYIGIKSDA